MKELETNGITFIERVHGTEEWFWGRELKYGDLYEAEEIFADHGELKPTHAVLIHYPDGKVLNFTAEAGEYFGDPLFVSGKMYLLKVCFAEDLVKIYVLKNNRPEEFASFPKSQVRSCYNLMLQAEPLMLTRQEAEEFEIVWPEQKQYVIGLTESFEYRDGNDLYFSAWYEDPDYHEELILRDYETGEIKEKKAGSLVDLPDGQRWLLK